MVTALTTLAEAREKMAGAGVLRAQLEEGILRVCPQSFVLGASESRLPTTVNVCLPGLDADEIVDWMATQDIALSAGSACSYGARKPSYVALAHGLSYQLAKSCVRISLSMESTEEEIVRFLQVFAGMMKSSPVSRHDEKESV